MRRLQEEFGLGGWVDAVVLVLICVVVVCVMMISYIYDGPPERRRRAMLYWICVGRGWPQASSV